MERTDRPNERDRSQEAGRERPDEPQRDHLHPEPMVEPEPLEAGLEDLIGALSPMDNAGDDEEPPFIRADAPAPPG